MYQAESMGFTVQVDPTYIATESASGVVYFLYSYTVTLSNHGPDTCQLLSRHWVIRDGDGREEHVMGDGVVGKQPFIRPGDSYTYRSGCPLPTRTGSMRGTYQMEGPERGRFTIRIPLFFLRPDSPRTYAAEASLNG